jgi:hypothetical protein
MVFLAIGWFIPAAMGKTTGASKTAVIPSIRSELFSSCQSNSSDAIGIVARFKSSYRIPEVFITSKLRRLNLSPVTLFHPQLDAIQLVKNTQKSF